jgi:hypothetical protein
MTKRTDFRDDAGKPCRCESCRPDRNLEGYWERAYWRVVPALARALQTLAEASWEERSLMGLSEQPETACGAVEPGPISVGVAHTCTAQPGHAGEHDW